MEETMPELPFQAHSETSKAAAGSAAPIATTERERVFDYIVAQEKAGKFGATDEETADALKMNPSTVRPRRVELLEQKRVQDSGHKRLTKAKRKAVVWEPVNGDPKPIKKRGGKKPTQSPKPPHCSTCTCQKTP